MTREEILDKIEDIQDKNYNKFKGSNEAELHIREDVADLIEEMLKAGDVSDTNEPCGLAGVTNIHVANLSKHELNKMRELKSCTLRIKSNNGIGSVVECLVDNEWVDITDYSCW